MSLEDDALIREPQQRHVSAGVVQEDVRGEGRLTGSFLARALSAAPGRSVWVPIIVLLAAAETMFSVVFRYAVSSWSQPCGSEDGESWLCTSAQAQDGVLHALAWEPGTWGGLHLVLLILVAGIALRALSWAGTLIYLGRVAVALHDRAVAAMSSTPVTFFDAQPTGRILGRMSDDYERIAREIPNYLSDILSGTLELVWAVGVVLAGAPWLLPLAVPCGYSYYRLQAVYVTASREIQRLSKVLEAPSLSLFSEALGAEAAQLIRVHGRSAAFRSELERRHAAFGKASMISSRMTRWLNMRLKMNAEIFALGVALFVIMAVDSGSLTVAFCGFLMSLSIGLDGTMQWVTRAVSLLEPSLVSVERVSLLGDLPVESADSTAAGAEPRLPGQEPGGSWRLVVDGIVAGYRQDLPDVLRGVSLTIEPGQRIGIIGRTGAGKSSLFQLLYRMVHVRSGRLVLELLDDSRARSGVRGRLDLLRLPLEQARSIFTIVPQQPVLFSGSIRHNLDRLGLWDDAELWSVLEKVRMAETVAGLPGGLSYDLSEGGGNLSMGERQLLCMARAALNPCPVAGQAGCGEQPRIVLLDEATASVDHHTDARISQAFDALFGSCTLLIIAHRLETVRQCDRVVAMSDGRIVADGMPLDVINSIRFDPEYGSGATALAGWL